MGSDIVKPVDVWNVLIADIVAAGSIGELLAEPQEAVFYQGNISASASYTPPDNHLVTAWAVGDVLVLAQMQDIYGWQPWITGTTISKMLTFCVASDGANFRFNNGAGASRSLSVLMMRFS